MSRFGIVILAAGASTRLGRPKQLLPFRGQSLVRRATDTALHTLCSPVVVVVGGAASQSCAELNGLDVLAVENPIWERGIGTSIRAGIIALPTDAIDGVLIMLCDQPLVEAGDLDRLVAACGQSHSLIAAAQYDGTVGTPAVFVSKLFPELCALPDDRGGKVLFARYAQQVVRVAIPLASFDVDSEENYARLLEMQ